jgi:pyruvate/2-oxoglutarate dehydrogenase complex dihydrolipoamide acyltransferase (E2) component
MHGGYHMITKIIMPRLGLTMEKGSVCKWYVKEGDMFKKGDILCEVTSEKSVSDVIAELDGRMLKVLVQENEEVDVINPIAIVEPI